MIVCARPLQKAKYFDSCHWRISGGPMAQGKPRAVGKATKN